MADAAPRKNSAVKAADAEGHAQQLRAKRAQQLKDYERVVSSLERELHVARTNSRTTHELSDHSAGFYDEISKLAKGRALVPSTQLVREAANDIIRDAKGLIRPAEDVHLNRIKAFVPAGDEPTYPEILITVRAVNDALRRHLKRIRSYTQRLEGRLRLASTAVGALTFVLNDEEADEDAKQAPPKESVKFYTEGLVSDQAFALFEGSFNEYYFDFDRLDSMTPEEYVSVSEDDDDDAEDDVLSDEQSESAGEEDSEDE